MGGPRRYIPAQLRQMPVNHHLVCDVCDHKLVGEIKAYDYEDYREKVIELSELHGWELGLDILCRDCVIERKIS